MVGNLLARETTRREWRMHREREREIVDAGEECRNVRKANEINICILASDLF
jgi:hypothetical protein